MIAWEVTCKQFVLHVYEQHYITQMILEYLRPLVYPLTLEYPLTLARLITRLVTLSWW